MADSPLKHPLDDEPLDTEAEGRRKRPYGQRVAINTQPQKQLRCEDYRVGVICALEFEMSAIRYMLDNEHASLPSDRRDSNLYVLGELSGHNVVVVCLPGNQGKGAAAAVSANMARTFPEIDLRLLVGIGGGVPSDKHDIRLGDVVISMPDGLHGGVVQYDLGKDTDERFALKGHLSPVPAILRSAVIKMQSDHRMRPSRINDFLMAMLQRGEQFSSYKRPQTEDILFQGDSIHAVGYETCDSCDMNSTVHRPPRQDLSPHIHYGLIASGDRVMRSTNNARLATRDLGNVLCFEMEAAGVLTEYPCLVVRGISDYADSHKNDSWQHYAAASAAACSKELLSYLDPGISDGMTRCRTTPTSPEPSVGPIAPSLSHDQKHQLLESLKFVQIDARRATVKRAHARTCKWFLRTPEYLKWLDSTKMNEHHGVLWVKGKPGAGKSTLMKFLLSNFSRAAKGKLVLDFFFNARGERLEKSTVGMYRSLLWQLLSKVPRLLVVFDSLNLRDLDIGDDHQWNIESLKELFQHAVQSLGQTSLVAFIDALDECDEVQIRDMLRFFADIAESAVTAGVPFHVLFSSRHYPHITISRGLELVLEGQEGHSQDIRDYIDKELKIEDRNLASQIRSKLQEKASGVFMWVVLVVDILNKEHDRGRDHALKRKLGEIPGDLHSLFRDILTRDQDDRDQLLLCVQWILFARQPLTPTQLYCVLLNEIEPEALEDWSPGSITDKNVRKFIVDCSKGLAETTMAKRSTVQFIHESVRDFLLKENGFTEIWPELSGFQGQSQERLKKCCLKYMNLEISSSVELKQPFPKAFSEDMAAIRTAANDGFPFLEYAVRNVLFHADMAAAAQVCQQAFLQDFSFSHWNLLHNLFEKHEVRRHTVNVSLQYILAEYNFPTLIGALPHYTSWVDREGDRYGLPLFAALATGSREAMQAILKVCAIQKPNSKLYNIYNQYISSMDGQKFLGRDFKFSKNRTVLSIIAELGDEMLFAFLLECGFSPRDKDKDGRTALDLAVEKGRLGIVKLLLEDSRVNLDAMDNRGNALLARAVLAEQAETVKFLLVDIHVDPTIQDEDGRTPLYRASELKNLDTIKDTIILGCHP
ncbi:hypothetical protein BDW62DRAFT_206857 [Aspergillus aurantiobrunneus]